MRFTIRPIELPADYPDIARLISSSPMELVTSELLQENDRKIPTREMPSRNEAGLLTGFLRRRVLALDESGRAVGYAEARRAPWTAPGEMIGQVAVDPACRGQGVGTALADWVEAQCREVGAASLHTWCRDDAPASLAFAQRRGLSIRDHIYESALDVQSFDESRFEGVVEGLKAQGIRFLTLTDAGETGVAKLYREVYCLADPDRPGNEVLLPLSEWHNWNTGAAGVVPEGVIIAAEGDQFVGMTVLAKRPAGDLYTLYTAVAPSHRGRKLALALKLLGIRQARAWGISVMRTDNHSANAPMLAVNRKLGYVPEPGVYQLLKTL